MEEFNSHYQKLPAFIQAELKWYVGSIQGLSLVQVIARHIAAGDYWLAKKNSNTNSVMQLENFAPADILDKQRLDSINVFLEGIKNKPYASNPEVADIIQLLTMNSIYYLTAFKGNMQRMLPQAIDAEHQQAQQAAAKEARRLAEKAVQELDQRQAEAAERHAARRQAEVAVVSALRVPVTNAAIQQLLSSPKTTLIEIGKAPGAQFIAPAILALPDTKAVRAAIDRLLLTAETKIRTAIDEFWLEIGSQTGIPTFEAFGAMLHAFKRNGVDTRLIAEAVIQH